ncbi:MAG TPA: hypothetical protein VHC20_06910 [Candidatus Paceibacterota bacterium]|nr:hypothetical protein [Candidatus Paceibacterota bacterium]
MQVSSRIVRNAAFVVLLVVAAVGVQRKVFAASCSSWTGTWDFINLYSCGEYVYDSDALPDMHNIADYYASAYNWGGGVYHDPYWYARLGSFEDPAYYDSAWPVCPNSWCAD